MATADRDLRSLFLLNRVLKDADLPAEQRIKELYDFLFENRSLPSRTFSLSKLGDWNPDDLQRALYFSEEISALYARYYHDSSVIPVTFYKREKRIRRHLDHEFSSLYKEIIRRSGRLLEPELITEEPIYYLMQRAREKGFPKAKEGGPNLNTLKSRFHLELARRLDPDASSDGQRRVLLPHEI